VAAELDCTLNITTFQRGDAAQMTLPVEAGSVDAALALQTACPDESLLHAWQRCQQKSAGFRCTHKPSSAPLGEFLAFLWLHDHPRRPDTQQLVNALTREIAEHLHGALPRPVSKRC